MAAPTSAAAATRAYVLSNNSIFWLDTEDGSFTGPSIAVSGLTAGDVLVGIDFRPINGFLYGLGYNEADGTVQLYLISHRTGQATPIGTTGTFVGSDGTTPVPIAGANFGLDFQADRLRVVNDAGQNFRINPNDGAFVDGDLGGTPGSVPGLNMDGAINGATTAVDALSFGYALSAETSSVYLVSPANAGTLTQAHAITVGGAALEFAAANGFDIASLGVAPAHTLGYAALTIAGAPAVYSIDVETGAATFKRSIDVHVQGLALQVDNPNPAPATWPNAVPAIALSHDSRLLAFLTVPSPSGTPVTVIGLVAGETLVGLDWRPQTGQLLGLGFNGANGSGSATLYRLDPVTGAATMIGSAGSIANGAGVPISLAGATAFGFDVDPATDRIRVVTDNGRNFRIHPNTGAVVGGALDPDLNNLPPGSTGVTAAAFTNGFGQSLVSGVATMYTLDPTSNRLLVQTPPASGTQTTGLPITLDGAPLDFTSANGFDIPPDVRVETSGAGATGQAFAALTVGGIASIYRLELSTGAAVRLGSLSPLTGFQGLAVGDRAPGVATVQLTPVTSPIVAHQSVTFAVTITPANAPGAATGTVAFLSDGVPILGCTAQPVASGAASCTTSFPLPGTYGITGVYGGDELNRGARTAAPQSVIVNKAPTVSTVAAVPSSQDAGQPVLLTAAVTPAIATGTVTFLVDGNPVGTVALEVGQAAFSISTLSIGTHQVTVSYSGDSAFLASVSPPTTATIVATGPRTQYFAEGATGFFHTDVGILNASATESANVTVQLFPEGAAPMNVLFTLPPLTRRTIDLGTVVGNVGGVSTLVSSDQAVAATRQMTWGTPVYGSTLESGIPDISRSWYFAEGATNVFSLYYLVQNPGAAPATVTLTHLLEGGAAPVTQTAVVPGFSRRTFYVNDVPGLASASMATAIVSDVPIVAERAMYLNFGAGRLWEGGTAGRGAPALNTTWTLAEGATGFFHTYLLLGNPNAGGTTVSVTYQLPNGATIVKSYAVSGQSRRTVDVNAEDPQLASTAVGMAIASTLPIVVERAMWWGEPVWNEGSAAVASTATGTVWAIGEGAEGGPNDEATFVLVANASATEGRTLFTVIMDDGSQIHKEYTLLGRARLTVRIGDEFPSTVGEKFSVLVESVTTGVPLTVDVSRYQSADGFLSAGGAAAATKIK